MWDYGKKKKGVYPAPSVGQDTRLCTSLRTQKERIPAAGFLQRRYPLYEALLCLIVGILPSLRRPALLLSSVLGQKTERTPQNPHFLGLSVFPFYNNTIILYYDCADVAVFNPA